MKKKLGVYIHIPFCKNICSYCDFCKVFYNEKWARKYFKALALEIKDLYMGEEIDTIYIGGGTPSSLSSKEIRILFKILEMLNIKDLKEVTFECNLNDLGEELLKTLKEVGVTRLSIGIESFNNEKLKFMGRNHSFVGAKQKIALARQFGFNNINLDLIYGFFFENKKILKDDLKKIIKLNPEHISTYSLMIENNTLLKKKSIETISEDEEVELYKYICKYLKKHGFNHYEVSNFAKKGYESVHNLKYWHNKEYYGFGLSASGYVDKIRYTNTKSLTKYLNGDFESKKNILTEKDIRDNYVMLMLRLLKGINLKEFKEEFKVNMEDVYPIKPLLKNKELILKKGNIFINPDKLYVMNEILIKMI